MDLTGVSLTKVLKGRDPNEIIPFSTESKSASLLFKVVEWDCVPLLDLLKSHGVKFDRVSENTDLLEHAIMKNSFDSLQWLFQCEELFDPSNDEEELNRRLNIAVELISQKIGKRNIKAIQNFAINRKIDLPKTVKANTIRELLTKLHHRNDDDDPNETDEKKFERAYEKAQTAFHYLQAPHLTKEFIEREHLEV
jgi:hypothetical protein